MPSTDALKTAFCAGAGRGAAVVVVCGRCVVVVRRGGWVVVVVWRSVVLVASMTRVGVFCARLVVGGASVDGGRVVVVADLPESEASVVLDEDEDDAEDGPVTELGTRDETFGAVIRPSRSTVAVARSTSGASVELEPLRVATELLGDGTPDVDGVDDPGVRPKSSAAVEAVPAGLPDEKVVGGAANKIVPSSPVGSPRVRPFGSGAGSPRNRPAIMSATTLVLEVA